LRERERRRRTRRRRRRRRRGRRRHLFKPCPKSCVNRIAPTYPSTNSEPLHISGHSPKCEGIFSFLTKISEFLNLCSVKSANKAALVINISEKSIHLS